MSLIAKQGRCMRRFEAAGVIDPASAKTLEALELRESVASRSLLRRGVLVMTPGGSYYLNREGADQFLQSQRRLALAVWSVFAAIMALVWAGFVIGAVALAQI